MLHTQAKLEALLDQHRGIPFDLRDWAGKTYHAGAGAAQFVIHFRTRQSFLRSLLETSLGFGESYATGEVTVEGDLEVAVIALVETYLRLDPRGWVPGWFRRLLGRSLARQKGDIEHHYGLGNRFYQFFLGQKLQYSCAYFRRGDESLDLAQEQKIEHIAAKLDLRPGQRLLDVGCGWGHLMFHAAETHGVQCLGLTLCDNQATYIREQAKSRGLPVEVQVRNFLESERRAEWDRVVSVGMLEHVGQANLDRYFEALRAVLKPRGVTLVHSISQMREIPGTDPFLQKHIFPGYWFPSAEGVAQRAVRRGLHVVDVENLRRHYALTIRRWRENFLGNHDAIKSVTGFGEPFLRMWDFYLCCAIAGFHTAQTHLMQWVLSNGPNDSYPLTRDFLYRAPAHRVAAGVFSGGGREG